MPTLGAYSSGHLVLSLLGLVFVLLVETSDILYRLDIIPVCDIITLQDVNNSKRLEQQCIEGLTNIDKSGLPGKYKAWMTDMALDAVQSHIIHCGEDGEADQQPPQTMAGDTTVLLFGRTLQQNLETTASDFFHCRGVQDWEVRLIMTLKDSRDEKVSRAGVEVRTGRKWSATKSETRQSRCLDTAT